MRKRYLVENNEPPYNLRVFSVAYDDALRDRSMTDDEYLQYVIDQNYARGIFPADMPYYIVDEGPNLVTDHACDTDCKFFAAWEWVDGVVVNMEKARAIHLTEIRRVRNEELVKLDVPWMKAVEAGNTSSQATIVTQKQTLRDLPATFSLDGYANPVALKAAWPTELPARE